MRLFLFLLILGVVLLGTIALVSAGCVKFTGSWSATTEGSEVTPSREIQIPFGSTPPTLSPEERQEREEMLNKTHLPGATLAKTCKFLIPPIFR